MSHQQQYDTAGFKASKQAGFAMTYYHDTPQPNGT